MSFFTVRLRGRRGRAARPAPPARRGAATCGSASGEEVARAIEDMAVRGAPAIGVTAAMGDRARARAARPTRSSARDARARDQRPARAHAPDGGEPGLGARADGARARARCVAAGADPARVRAAARALAQRIHDDDVASCRAIGDCGRGAPAAGRARAHPLQRRRARDRRLRHRARRRAQRRARGPARARGGAGDAPVPAGRAAHRLGARARRHPGHARDRRHGRRADGARRDRRWSWSARTGSRPTATSRTRSAPTRWRCWRARTACPFYVAAPFSTVDLSTRRAGREIPIEQRSSDEVTRFAGRQIAPGGRDRAPPGLRRDAGRTRDRDRHRARRRAAALRARASRLNGTRGATADDSVWTRTASAGVSLRLLEVLIVEDDRALARTLARAARAGRLRLPPGARRERCARSRRRRPRPDLILIDLLLPKKDGNARDRRRCRRPRRRAAFR